MLQSSQPELSKGNRRTGEAEMVSEGLEMSRGHRGNGEIEIVLCTLLGGQERVINKRNAGNFLSAELKYTNSILLTK